MSVSARDPDEYSLLGAMRHQIEITQMPAPRRLLRAPAVLFAGHPRILAGGATAAVAATAAVLAIGAATTAPSAFAVTDNQDGSVTITLNEITGVSAFNTKLASMGIAVRAVPVVSGCTATAQVVGPDGGLEPASTLAVTQLPPTPTTGSQSTLRAVTVDPPHTGAGSSTPGTFPLRSGGESTIQLGSQ
jgi:hypothetical protein